MIDRVTYILCRQWLRRALVAIRSRLSVRTGLEVALQVLLLGSLALNVLQHARIATLVRLDDVSSTPGSERNRGASDTSLRLTDFPGMQAPANSGQRAGRASGAVIYVYSDACLWCKVNLPSIRKLSHDVGQKYKFIGISLSPPGVKNEQDVNLGFTSYHDLSEPVLVRYGLTTTPQTLVVASTGAVVKRWRGAFLGSNKKEIEEFFSARLPDLTPARE